MKAWRPRIPRYPALHLTPLSIEFHNWERARFLPGLNEMPLLLQKAEINNYPHADQHRFSYNWYFSTSMIHFPLGCFCQKKIFDWKVRPYRAAFWNVLSTPTSGRRPPKDTPRKETEGHSDNGHGTTKWVAAFRWVANPQKGSGFVDLCATLWQEQLFGLLYLRVTCWKNAPTQPNETVI